MIFQFIRYFAATSFYPQNFQHTFTQYQQHYSSIFSTDMKFLKILFEFPGVFFLAFFSKKRKSIYAIFFSTLPRFFFTR